MGNARLSAQYAWQGEESVVTGYSDSCWAGCRVTGKSASGGAIMVGPHVIKGWFRTQNHVTLSPAEAELIALVKCTAETLGRGAVMRDSGRNNPVCFMPVHQPPWKMPSERVPASLGRFRTAQYGSMIFKIERVPFCRRSADP